MGDELEPKRRVTGPRRALTDDDLRLRFEGPPLSLPGELAPTPAPETPNPSTPSSVPPPEEPGADAWARLRESAAPKRLTPAPPPAARASAIGLVTRRSRPSSVPSADLHGEMEHRYSLGDFTGALRAAELLLGQNPEDPQAARRARACRERLEQIALARIATLAGASREDVGSRTPHVIVPDREIRWLGLDHRQGFLLSRIDGQVSVQELVDLVTMSPLEVFQTLVELLDSQVIGLR